MKNMLSFALLLSVLTVSVYAYTQAFYIGAPTGEPVTPGDEIQITSSDQLPSQIGVVYVTAMFYQNNNFLGEVTQSVNNVTINNGYFQGSVQSLDFGNYYYADEVKLHIASHDAQSRVFHYESYNSLTANYDLPVAPTLDWIGILLIITVLSFFFFKFTVVRK